MAQLIANISSRNNYLLLCIWVTTILFYLLSPILLVALQDNWRSILLILVTVTGWHQAATIFIYLDKDAKSLIKSRKVYFFYVPLCLVLSLFYIFYIMPNELDKYIILLYGLVTIWHYQRQNWGMYNLYTIIGKMEKITLIEKWLINYGMVPGLMGFWFILGSHDDAIMQNTIFFGYLDIFEKVGIMFLMGLVVAFMLFAVVNVVIKKDYRIETLLKICLLFALTTFYWPLYFIDNKTLAFVMFAGNHGLQYFFIMGIVASNSSVCPQRIFKKTTVIMNVLVMFLVSVVCFKLFWEITSLPLPISNMDVKHALSGVILGCALSHYYIDSKLWRMKDPYCRAYMGLKILKDC